MSTYRHKLEEQIIVELREWLDAIEEQYGPTFGLESYAFIGAVGFTPEGEEAEAGESFARSAVGYHCSDARHWAQIGLMRQALLIAEANGQE
jgi:hypothetical protein